MNFSVLMSVYFKENPLFLDRSMLSIWDEQMVKPSEIVLVEDGPLTNDLYAVIDKWKDKLGSVLNIVKLEHNVGLGDALAIGIKKCTYDLVARMDSDDISMPYRFQKQLDVFMNSNIDVCGSWINEFDRDENIINFVRIVPEHHSDIEKFAKNRNPINHMAVMFKKRRVLEAGNYQRLLFFEDYYLWMRMILNNSTFINIQESLVKVRAGKEQLLRRQGFAYALYELKALWLFYKKGFIGPFVFIRNSVLKFLIRIMPKSFIKWIYYLLRDKIK